MGVRRSGWTLAELCLAWMLMLGAGSCVGVSAHAQTAPATTAISDTVYHADGTAAAGTVLISWPSFSTLAGDSVPAGSTSVTIGAGGALSVHLVANAGSTPMGSYYTVIYHLDDGSQSREYWVVPVTSSTVAVNTIRSTVLPASVAMQTVSKAYVDTAIAAAVAGTPLDSTPYVLKAGDTMTGPLNLPGDPTSPLQASDKNYVDEQVAGLTGGTGQKVSLMPAGAQTVTQPAGTELAVNSLNGVQDANQYVTGSGNNGIANATASANCAGGCHVEVEQGYPAGEAAAPTTWNNQTHVVDQRGGSTVESFFNPEPMPNNLGSLGRSIDLNATQTAQSILAATGNSQIFSTGEIITSNALAGGSNVYPPDIQGTVPYFKTTYSGLHVTGNNNTLGQHVLFQESQNCYGVGDCLAGSITVTASGGARDNADEGAHPFDRDFSEDTRVFTGTCSQGCTTGSTSVQITPTASGGTQGEGRYLIDTNPAKAITVGSIVGAGASGGRQPSALFAGTSFPVSVFLETTQAIPTQSNSINPGTVTVPIATSAVPAGFATNTAALPATSGVACISDVQQTDGRALNFETAAYTAIDASHLRITLVRPHASGATIAAGGLCGYGLEQKVDTVNGIRQVFPVIGSTSSTSLLYAGAHTAIVGVQGLTSAYINASLVVASISRTGNLATVTTVANLPADLNDLTLTIANVADASYNGNFVVTTTGPNSFTYANSGANSTSTGGTVTYLTGSYGLYPMAEVETVFNPSTKAVDGQMTLAANTVNWAAGDSVEQPHYYQEQVSADTDYITQFTPRSTVYQTAGISYSGNNSAGLFGWTITNNDPAGSYFGNGGTHTAPYTGMNIVGIWNHSMDMQAGESAVFDVHCNSHGCGRWNSGYDLFDLDSSSGTDRVNYSPSTSTLTYYLGGTAYTFSPQNLTAGTIDAGTLNATTVNGHFVGTAAASSLPVFIGSGGTHQQGAVPDPGATAGTTRFLREDGTWNAPAGSGSILSTVGYLDGSPVAVSGFQIFSVVNMGASSVAGTITQVKANIAGFNAGTGQLSLAVFQATGTNQYQIVQRVPLTVSATGTQTWNAGTDFVAPPIAVGQFMGYVTSANVSLEFGGNAPTTAITWYDAADPGTAAVTYNSGGTQSVVATVTSADAPVDTAVLAAGSIPVALAAVSPYRGLRLGVWGHSLTVPGYEYSSVTGTTFTYWQQYLSSLLGMTWTFNDGLAGRGYYNLFTNYPGISLSNMTAASTGSSSNGGVNGGPTTTGTTLAQDLANVDVLLLWNGDNDYGTKALGTPGDAASANTNYGDLDNALSIIFTAKPTIRVMLIDHGFAGRTFGIGGYFAIRTWLQTGGAYYGVGVMDMLLLSGLNPLTWSTWQNNDSGAYLHPTNAGWAHFVPIMARNLNSY
jgi:hypothetical protein